MPCPPPPPLGKRTDPDLLLTDVLPQPFRMIQSELYRIVDDAAEIGWRNQQEEEERSRQPSTTAERTIGPMTEPSIDARTATPVAGEEGSRVVQGPTTLGDVALMADFGNCPRPFYARADGNVIEVADDSTIGELPRPAELSDGESAKWLAATCCHGLEVVAMLSSNDFLFIWRRAPAAPEPMLATQGSLGDENAAEEFRREAPKLELKAALKVAPVDEQEPFQKCVLSEDATVVALVNDKVVACYTNPVPVGPEEHQSEPTPLISGELEGRLCVALNADQDKKPVVEEPALLLPDVFLLSRPVASKLGSAEYETQVSFAVVVWLGTCLFERHSLLPALPGEVPLEGGEANELAEPYVRRWSQTGEIMACAISPNSGLLATALKDGCTIVWDLDSGMTKFVLQRHIGAVEHVCFSYTHAVTVGAVDRILRSYSIETGELIVEVEAPRCGIRHLVALQETALSLAVTSWGLKLIDLNSGSIFADISTPDPQVVPDMQVPSVAFSEIYLHVMALRPADPPVYPEGEEPEPPTEGEEAEEVLWRVPLQLQLQRIVLAHQQEQTFGASQLASHTNTELGAPDITQTMQAPPSPGDNYGKTSSSIGSALTRAHSRQTAGGTTQVVPNWQSNESLSACVRQGAGEKYMPHQNSPCCLPNPEQFDLIGRVREYAENRHGERRLREIRMKKRLAAMLDTMKAAEE